MDLQEQSINCPYCGESIDILLDTSAGKQEYYEDCSVCCRPIYLQQGVTLQGDISLIIKREDES